MSSRNHVSKLVPSSDILLFLAIVGTSFADSVLTGFDSSLMGSLNVMPAYQSYFILTTATTALNTASSYIGGCLGSLFAGSVADWYGRRTAIWLGAAITIVGAIIQAAAVHIAMFIVGRIIIGIGMAVAATATPTFVVEVAKPSYRAFALGVYYACYGVGSLLSTAVCYGANNWTTTWAWRFPSLFQIVPGIFAGAIVCFLPESPRWLVSQGRSEEALEVLAIVNSHGDKENAVVLHEFEQIAKSIHSAKQKQLTLAKADVLCIVMLCGDSIITYYFGSMLSQAGITDSDTQLKVNIVLTSWNLVLSIIASFYVDCLPRKVLCSLSLAWLAIFQYLLGGLTARYGNSHDTSALYATVASIFLCKAAYNLGITPLTMLYPAEILSYQIRATGMGLYTFTTKAAGLLSTMVSPFALEDIGWKTYMIFGSVDIGMIVFVLVFWVETRGLGLEDVDSKFAKRDGSQDTEA